MLDLETLASITTEPTIDELLNAARIAIRFDNYAHAEVILAHVRRLEADGKAEPVEPTRDLAPPATAKQRRPFVVQCAYGRWDVRTHRNEKKGSYYLAIYNGPKWFRYDSDVQGRCGLFQSEANAKAALAKAPPVPANAVWEDEPEAAGVEVTT